MPTKHIDAAQWDRIEAMTVDLVREKNVPIKEGDVLKEVIATGLETLSGMNVNGLIDRFTYRARHSAILMSKLKPSGTATTQLSAPTAATAAALLEDSTAFIVCVYGNTNSGRSTFASALADTLNAANGLTVNLYDDASATEIRQAWADYETGRGAVVVVHQNSQIEAINTLYSTHRSILNLEDTPELSIDSGIPLALNTSLLKATMRSRPESIDSAELKDEQ